MTNPTIARLARELFALRKADDAKVARTGRHLSHDEEIRIKNSVDKDRERKDSD